MKITPKRTPSGGYKSEAVLCEFWSDLGPRDAEELIGKTIQRVEAREYRLRLFFTDGTSLMVEGSRWGKCALGVELGG